MIGWGCAVWGSGWYYPPYMYGGYRPIYYPYPHTYGMGAWYNPHTGAYGRGYRAYGPYGGVGMGASYNPRTGTYARGAAAYGPGGSRGAAQAYNPRTGTYAQTRQGSNVYGNWGTSSVQRGDNWAQTAHRTNYGPGGSTTSGIRTSNGGAAVNRSALQDRRRLAGPPVAMCTRAMMATCTGGLKAADGNKATGPVAGLQPKEGTVPLRVAKGTVALRPAQPALATVSRATVPRARLPKRISSNATAARVRKVIPEPRRAAAGSRAVRRDQERAAIAAVADEPAEAGEGVKVRRSGV